MTTEQSRTIDAMLQATWHGDTVARLQCADALEEAGREEEAALLRGDGPIIVWPPHRSPTKRYGAERHREGFGVAVMIPGDTSGRDFSYAMDYIMSEGEFEYVNQEEDGFDYLAGECWLAHDVALCVIHGTFGRDNSPGVIGYTYGTVYATRAEYDAAVAEWEAKPEYVEVEHSYEVVVANVGTVYAGKDEVDAVQAFSDYVALSVEDASHRCHGEDVTLFEDGEPREEHTGELASPSELDTDSED